MTERDRENQENPFEAIETRIQFIKTFWERAQQLGLTNQTTFDQDYLALSSIEWPESIQKRSERYMQLAMQTSGAETNQIPLSANEQDELDTLGQDPDVKLYYKFTYAAAGIATQREIIRNIIQELSDGSSIPGETKDFTDQVQETILQPFSIQFIIEKHAFDELLPRFELDKNTQGFYIKGTGITYIRSDTKIDRNELLKHEDFHAFIDAAGLFIVNEIPSSLDSDLLDFGKKLQTLRPKIGEVPSREYHATLEEIRILILRRLRPDHEELIAELASSPSRDDLPKRTYHGISARLYWQLTGQSDLVRRYPFILYPDLLVATKPILQYINVDSIRYKLKKLYAKVQAEIPDRQIEVDIAIALFPIDQLDEVNNLVDYWIQQKHS